MPTEADKVTITVTFNTNEFVQEGFGSLAMGSTIGEDGNVYYENRRVGTWKRFAEEED